MRISADSDIRIDFDRFCLLYEEMISSQLYDERMVN
jgi:hypothetical protein